MGQALCIYRRCKSSLDRPTLPYSAFLPSRWTLTAYREKQKLITNSCDIAREEQFMDIKNIYDAVIFTSAALTIKDAIVEAVSKKANLRGANLYEANLHGAN